MIEPLLSLGLPFADLAVSDGWQEWPALPDLFPTSFPGVKTSRDGFLVDVDLDRLKTTGGRLLRRRLGPRGDQPAAIPA